MHCMMLYILAVNMAKKVYLLVYNGVQWAGFILIVINLLKCLIKGQGGPHALNR